jgi:Rrf2 family protein
MQSILQISKRIDYALRAMLHLASLPSGAVVSFREIARCCGLPKDFLAKIMKTLSDRELVQSIRGASGGYRLARDPAEISVLDVVEAVEGPISLSPCLESRELCENSIHCLMVGVWQDAQDSMLGILRQRNLLEVAQGRPTTRSLRSLSRKR